MGASSLVNDSPHINNARRAVIGIPMNLISDVAASPVVAVPITSGVAVANIVAFIPIIINVLTVGYLSLLIGHKIWVWYKEYKASKQGIIPEDKDGLV